MAAPGPELPPIAVSGSRRGVFVDRKLNRVLPPAAAAAGPSLVSTFADMKASVSRFVVFVFYANYGHTRLYFLVVLFYTF